MSGPSSPPRIITADWLNGLLREERATFLRGDWARQMQAWAASHTTFLRWTRRTLLHTISVNNGTMFFLRLGDKLFGVTAAHVYNEYIAHKRRSGNSIFCHVGNLEFDPVARLAGIGSDDAVDIATFSFSWEELRQLGKQAILGEPWPPPIPEVGQAVYLSGFPGSLRLWSWRRELSFAIYSGVNPINRVDEHSITVVLDRAFWVSSEGEQLPPEIRDIGGMSGGPLLLPLDRGNGEWSLTLAGVISNGAFGAIVHATPAHCISEDGSVRS